MKNRKRLGILVLVIMMLLPLGQFAGAVADNYYTEGDFVFKISNNKAYIQQYTGRDTDVTVPATALGYPVIGVNKDVFASKAFIKSVMFEEGIEYIGSTVFKRCTSLQQVYLPSTLTSIGDGVFSFCTALKSIVIPDGVATISDYAFSGCYGLTDIQLPATLTELGCGVFSHCTSLKTIVLPGSLSEIKVDTFRKCAALQYIEIPASVYKIDVNAFSNVSRKQYTFITYDDTAAFHYAEKYGVRTMTPDMMAKVRANNP